jgi:hypothetical protein
MRGCGLMFLLLVPVAWGQGNTLAPVQNPSVQESAPAPAHKSLEEMQAAASKVPLDATVITVAGLCDHSPDNKAFAPDCKTVMTRAEFEAIAVLLQSHTSPLAHRALAHSYIQTLIKARKAQEMGLDKRPDFDDRVEVVRMFVEGQSLYDRLKHQEWDKITDKEIEDYYHNHPSEFVELDVERLFVPFFPLDDDDPAFKKLSDSEKVKSLKQQISDLKAEAEMLRARALAGENILDLEKAAYKFTGVASDSIGPADITLKRLRRSMLGSGQIVGVTDVQEGQFSPLFAEDNGYYVFKVTKRVVLPFDKVKGEIHTTIRNQRFTRDKDDIDQLASTSAVYNNDYFGPPPPKAAQSPAAAVNPAQVAP